MIRFFLTSDISCKGDCIYFYPENLKGFYALPYFWNTSPLGSGLGYFALPTLSFSPPSFILGTLNQVFGLYFEVIEKMVWFIPIILLSVSGMILLSRMLNLSSTGSIFAGLLYLFNTYLILLIDGGQVGIALAYSLVPWVFMSFIEGLENPKNINKKKVIARKILSGLILGILSSFDLRVGYIVFGMILFYTLFVLIIEKKAGIKNVILSIFPILIIPFGLHFYWLFPAFLTRATSQISPDYTQISQLEFLNWTNMTSSLYLFQPHWQANLFGKVNPTPFYFFLIPLFVFINLLFKPKLKIYYFIFLSLASIFLIKGTGEPIGGIYRWLFKNIPGFNMFRDSSKFYIPLTFSYSLLFGYSIEKILKKVEKRKILNLLITLSVFLYIFFLMKPLVSGEMLGVFRPQKLPTEYLEFKNLMTENENFSRSIWYPHRKEFVYSSANYPAIDATYDLLRIRPLDIAISGTYDFFSYLEHPFSRQLFDVLGIKYVVAANPTKEYELSESEIKDRDRLLTVLDQTFWLKKIKEGEKITLFKTDFEPKHFFAVNKIFYVVGSDDLYWKLDSFPNFNLKNTGLIFLEGHNLPMEKLELTNDNQYLVFNNKNWEDLIFLTIDRKYFISPAESIKENKLPDKSWVVKTNSDYIAWRDILARKSFSNLDFDLNSGFVFADDNPQKLNFSFNRSKLQEGDLYVRYFSNDQGGKFNLKIDGKNYTSVTTFSKRNNFVWMKIGELSLASGKHQIELENIKGFNAVNTFALIPTKEFLAKTKEIKKITNENQLIYFYEPGEASNGNGLNLTKDKVFEVLLKKRESQSNRYKLKIAEKSFEGFLSDKNSWLSLGKFQLKEGVNKLEVLSDNIEELVLFEKKNDIGFIEMLNADRDLPVVQTEFINPTKYSLKIINNKPFTLVFSEKYNSLWEASVNNQENYNSLPVYSIINGFEITRTGDYQIQVEFTPQGLLFPALWVSLATFIISAFLIILLQYNK